MSNFNKFIEENELWRNAGQFGLDNLNKICEEIGYKEQKYNQGSPLEEFLRDNSGAIEVLKEFISREFDAEFEEYNDDLDSYYVDGVG